ncbi:nucleotide sugar dehydrogenase [Halobium salinum]|uniref:UDP-N-acetyl-D-mannosamine dehydrogenase n=1 Tax=Halobium salinum TaxID=1364940 RepID=A0ABD5PAU9_9EURY|nr:nucleotide sugar dehydrogenase [Halobium salinum]
MVDAATGVETEADTVGLYGSDLRPADRREAFTGGRVPVAVYGLGKMGLPLAAAYSEASNNVIGVDVNPDVVESVNAGECHVDNEPDLPELIAERVEAGALRATTDLQEAAAEARVHVVIVPTPITDEKEPDLSILEAVVEDVATGLKPGDQVIVECTVPPRTSADYVRPRLAELSGLDEDEFGVAFCPERTSSGRALQDIGGAYPKVVGGVDAEAAAVCELIYGEINSNDILVVSDATTAESVKLFEGLYRDVNIALANELATLADDLGIDVVEAIDVANTQPFCEIHDPGPGVGGHCIPWYPYFVMSRVERDTPLLRTAREVNDGMPGYTVDQLTAELGAEGVDADGARVLVLGVTYRPGVKETRASPAIPIIEGLKAAGAEVYAVDPMVDPSEYGATAVDLDEVADGDYDAAVMVTHHEEFDALDWSALDDLVVVDGRRTLDLDGTDHRVYELGRARRADAAQATGADATTMRTDGGPGERSESGAGSEGGRGPESGDGSGSSR